MSRGSDGAIDTAAKIGLSHATLIRAERGKHEPTARNMARLCHWLNRPFEDFVKVNP